MLRVLLCCQFWIYFPLNIINIFSLHIILLLIISFDKKGLQ